MKHRKTLEEGNLPKTQLWVESTLLQKKKAFSLLVPRRSILVKREKRQSTGNLGAESFDCTPVREIRTSFSVEIKEERNQEGKGSNLYDLDGAGGHNVPAPPARPRRLLPPRGDSSAAVAPEKKTKNSGKKNGRHVAELR